MQEWGKARWSPLATTFRSSSWYCLVNCEGLATGYPKTSSEWRLWRRLPNCPIFQWWSLILQANARNLFNLKGLLRSFSDSTWLHVNFHESFLALINVHDSKAIHLANTLGCNVGTMPFTYLGLPLGTTRPSIQDFTPLLYRIESILAGISIFLSN